MVVWRGSKDTKDKIFGALVYLIPLYAAMPFGSYLLQQFPVLQVILIPLTPVGIIYSFLPFGLGGLIVFFALYLAVVRNEKVSHFIRYNAMQAILVNIALSLISLVFFQTGIFSALPSVLLTLGNVIFIAVLAICIYSIVQCVRGLYAEIPNLSQFVYNQVP